MSDLGSAILILGCLCTLVFFAGCRVSGYPSRRRRLVIQILVAALLPIYFVCLWDRPILATILPMSGLIILSNWVALWASFFLGIYATTPTVGLLRRQVIGFSTAGLVVYSTVAPSLGTGPECVDGVGQLQRTLQFQTTPYTCSAAAATSLLRLHDIPATEGELAELCLTRRGTHWMGVFRGLKLKTQGTGWTVIAEPFDHDMLDDVNGPCVLTLNIDVSGFSPGHDHGFSDDVGHTVVYLGSSDRDCSVVFDPSPDFGVEDWQPSTRSCIRDGVILRLVPDGNSSVSTTMVGQRVQKMLDHRRLTAGLTQLGN